MFLNDYFTIETIFTKYLTPLFSVHVQRIACAVRSGMGPQFYTPFFLRYEFILDSPISVVQKKGDDTLTYLNKGDIPNFILNYTRI